MSKPKLIAFAVPSEHQDFVTRGVNASGQSYAGLARESFYRAIAALLGEDAPERIGRGSSSVVAQRANSLGMSRPQFTRYASLVVSGVDEFIARERVFAETRKPRQPKIEGAPKRERKRRAA